MNIQGIASMFSAPLQAQATSNTSSTSGTSSSGTSATETSSSDLQTMFLNLLVTELQNQDPTQPVDPTEMVGQMISLNQLDQLVSINQTLSSLGTSTASTASTQATAASSAPHQTTNGALERSTPLALQPTAFQQLSSPYSGSLMSLYGNIGAPATGSNQFTSLGGK